MTDLRPLVRTLLILAFPVTLCYMGYMVLAGFAAATGLGLGL